MNQFKFHSVGQGLFYSGSLNDKKYNFVYDCGTSTDQKYIQREINLHLDNIREIQNNNIQPHIDFVAISHLHYDHYSGLKYLMHKAQVKNIILPYFIKDLNLLNLTLYHDAMVTHELSYEQCKENTEVITALYKSVYYGETIRFDDNRLPETTMLSTQYGNKTTVSGKQHDYIGYKKLIPMLFDEEDKYWQFMFTNKTIKSDKWEKFKTNIEKALLSCTKKPITPDSFIEYIESCDDKLSAIKKIYTKTFGKRYNLNLTSTVMLHYPLYPAYGYYENCGGIYNGIYVYPFFHGLSLCAHNNIKKYDNAVSLLCGDIEFDDEIFQTINCSMPKNESVDNIFVLQVPHHGSLKNWKSVNKFKIFSRKYVISYGLGNSYKHPNKKVIKDMVTNCYDFSLVNQINSFGYIIN